MNKEFMSYFKIYSLIVLLFFVSACSLFEKKESSQNSNIKFVLIDVNDNALFNDAKIAGSINISYDDLEDKTKNWNKKNNIVIYCTDYACTESYRVAKKIINLGFENVQVYKGGIQEWYQLSKVDNNMYPFEGKATEAFLNKEIVKLELEDEGIKIISAQDLSKLVNENKK